MKIVGLEVEKETEYGEGGFLKLRRVHLKNRRSDDSLSRSYLCDFIERPGRQDAVVVALYHRRPGGIDVLLRDGLRPPLQLSRGDAELYYTEVVAGVIEAGDTGAEGRRLRVVAEVWEEAGYRVTPEQVEELGDITYPSPGAFPEAFYFSAVEIADPATQEPLEGDGSPMEEGAKTRWVDLDTAIADCVAGRIRDLKTELILRRLRDRLRGA